jgi:hypothetical protein
MDENIKVDEGLRTTISVSQKNLIKLRVLAEFWKKGKIDDVIDIFLDQNSEEVKKAIEEKQKKLAEFSEDLTELI